MNILNTGRYALSFTIVKNGRETKIAFDRRRVYYDTGNIATSGITEISDEDFAELKKDKNFLKCMESGDFTEVTDDQLRAMGDTSVELKAKDEEIKKLKEELKAKAPTKKELENKDKEIASLKAQLEALTEGKKAENATEADTTGF